jgi:NADH:ubiquinone oxidoreductase subunit
MIFFIAVISFRSWIYKKIITVQQPKHKSKNRLRWQKFTDQAVNRTRPQSLPHGNVILFQNHREGQ